MNAPANVQSTGPARLVLGVSRAAPAGARIQRALALSVMILPFLGTIAALAIAHRRGVSRLDLGLLVCMYVIQAIGVTIGYHRMFTHRAFTAGRVTQLVLTWFGATAGQGPILYWAATHRRHHVYSDREGDPHSPNMQGLGLLNRLRGFWHGHMGWMLSNEVTSWPHYARDLMRDDFVVLLHELYPLFFFSGMIVPALVGGLATGSATGALTGFLWGGLMRMFLGNQATWCVGSLSHMYGSRPFATKDRSRNNWIVALFTFGEGLQNNHHAFPTSAAHALRWWEPDASELVIRVMQWLGLVWNIKRPSERAVREARQNGRNPTLGPDGQEIVPILERT